MAQGASGPVTQPFGCTGTASEPPLGSCAHFHRGVDIGASCGDPVTALQSGTVQSAGWDDTGYGNLIRIDHGGGYVSLYGHLSAFAVSTGQQVAAGQQIGSVGSTGNSTGCHLHQEIDLNGTPIDPFTAIPAPGGAPSAGVLPQLPSPGAILGGLPGWLLPAAILALIFGVAVREVS
jgi:murein DD-endopeptidase MepM/ murein hydrolase activator NlpD